jgi:hypothetical protein
MMSNSWRGSGDGQQKRGRHLNTKHGNELLHVGTMHVLHSCWHSRNQPIDDPSKDSLLLHICNSHFFNLLTRWRSLSHCGPVQFSWVRSCIYLHTTVHNAGRVEAPPEMLTKHATPDAKYILKTNSNHQQQKRKPRSRCKEIVPSVSTFLIARYMKSNHKNSRSHKMWTEMGNRMD